MATTLVQIDPNCAVFHFGSMLFVLDEGVLLSALEHAVSEQPTTEPQMTYVVEGLGAACQVVTPVGEFNPDQVIAELVVVAKNRFRVRSLSWPMH